MLTLISSAALILAGSTFASPAPEPSTPSLAERGPTFVPIHSHDARAALSKRDGATSSLTDVVLSTLYAVDVSVGTPPQTAPYIVELAHAAPLLLGTCSGDYCGDVKWNVFQSKASKSYTKLGKGTVLTNSKKVPSGLRQPATWGSDTFSVNGFNASVAFAQMDSSPAEVGLGSGGGPAGYLRLAPAYSWVDYLYAEQVDLKSTQPFVQQAAAQWADKQFGLYIRRSWTILHKTFSGTTIPRKRNAGQLALGGVNPALYTGNFTYVNTVNASWTVPLEAIELNGKTIDLRSSSNSSSGNSSTSSSVTAAPSSSASTGGTAAPGASSPSTPGGLSVTFTSTARGFAFPQSVCDRILNAVPGWTKTYGQGGVSSQELYSLPSNNLSLTFTFGGVKYPMEPIDWMVSNGDSASSGASKVANMGCRPDESGGIIGLAFLQTVYTAFRLEPTMQVGFAKAVDSATADKVFGASYEATDGGTKNSGAGSVGASAAFVAAICALGYLVA